MSLPCGTGFEGIKGSERAAEPWHYGIPGASIHENAFSVEVDTPGLQIPWRNVELAL